MGSGELTAVVSRPEPMPYRARFIYCTLIPTFIAVLILGVFLAVWLRGYASSEPLMFGLVTGALAFEYGGRIVLSTFLVSLIRWRRVGVAFGVGLLAMTIGGSTYYVQDVIASRAQRAENERRKEAWNELSQEWNAVGARTNVRYSEKIPVTTVIYHDIQGDRLLPLTRYDKIETLALSDTDANDDDLKNIVHLSQLRSLRLDGTNITDKGLVHLKDLRNLRSLRLSGTKITDDGLRHLEKLTQLMHLHLDGTRIADEGMKHIADLPNLITLNIERTSVSDASVDAIEAMPKLRRLLFDNTKISIAGSNRLEGRD